jgi:hypothetical protein
MSERLHWTFDYSQFNGDGSEFEAELMRALEAVYADGIPAGPVSEYIVLPNYWGGYCRGGQDSRLAFGNVSIGRKPAGDTIDYRVDFYHDASGEKLKLQYRTDNSPLRQLRGSWRIDVSNDAPGAYNGFQAEGQLTDSREIRLAWGDTPLACERLPDDRPLLCNWTLFDVMPELAKLPANAEFALLEDLEKVKPRCRVGPLDSCRLSPAETDLALEGFVVFGQAQTPFYFWLDARGNVAIASGVFNTFVACKAGGTA